MKKIILILAAMLTLAACTKEGDVIYQTDPADAPSTTPLVTVIYDPNAVGDGNYNDLIYQSVEQAAREHDLRTMHLSPSTRAEGLAYLETLFEQMSVAQDTVRRLFIVAAASYDDYLRRNNRRLEANPYTDLLYLETSEPLDGKGSTLCLPYYGAMYEAGGFTVADTTAIHVMYDRQWTGYFKMLVPVCGGAARTFQYLNDMMGGYDLAGVNVFYESIHSSLSVIKHIDRAVALCISQWLSPEGMPKHQSLGLADGYTGVVVKPESSYLYDALTYAVGDVLTDELRTTIHNDAIRKEAEYGK